MAAPKENVKELYTEQISHRTQGKHEQALKIIDKLTTEFFGQQYDLVREKAHCLYEMGKEKEEIEQAIIQYKLAIDLVPPLRELSFQQKIDYSNTYVGQARAYAELENYEEALILLKKAKEICIDNKERIDIEKALVYYKQDNLNEAQEILYEVAQSQNKKISQEAYYRLGFITENPKLQEQYFLKADLSNHIILFNLGNCYMRLNKYNDAIKTYNSALQMKQVTKYYYNLAKCYEINGQYEEAIETQLQVLSNENRDQIQQIISRLNDNELSSKINKVHHEREDNEQYIAKPTDVQNQFSIHLYINYFS